MTDREGRMRLLGRQIAVETLLGVIVSNLPSRGFIENLNLSAEQFRDDARQSYPSINEVDIDAVYGGYTDALRTIMDIAHTELTSS